MEDGFPCRVRAVHCDHRATDEQVYQALKRATEPLDRAWARIRAARRITIKFNQAWPADHFGRSEQPVYLDGVLQELVDLKVARATLRLIREQNPGAELLCVEIAIAARHQQRPAEDYLTLMPALKEYGATFVDGDEPPFKTCAVPGGGLIFKRYLLSESVVDTDAFVSVQKIKNHAYMGVTLCMKNLFGLLPMETYSRSRAYFHHLIRLPYVLVDLARTIHPTLNIIDGLVGQSGREWGGEGRVCDTLVAGDHVTATDACGTHLMGFDPLADWPDHPFLRDRNPLRIAHDHGFGTADLAAIDFRSEVQAPVASFRAVETDPFETVLAWRRSACEQALYYRDHRKQLIDQYAGEYILLQDNEVRWHDRQGVLWRSRRDLAGLRRLSAMWLKYVDPEEAEGEHLEVYEDILSRLRTWPG